MCDEFGALLIFDEVVTGFRLGMGGAQAYFGVKPDLTVFGKCITGGYPMAGGVGGRRDVMLRFAAGIGGTGERAYVGGTLSANPLSCAAGYYALLEMERTHAPLLAGRAGDRLTTGLNALIEKYGLPYVAYNQGSIVHLETSGTMLLDFKNPFKLLKELKPRKHMMEEMGAAYMANGIVTLAGSRMYTSMADTDDIIDDAAGTLREGAFEHRNRLRTGEPGMSDSPLLTTQPGRFIDPQGRQVILHGINLVNKDAKAGYLGPEDLKTFAAFRRWGLNCVRLGIIWDGLEPEPGVFNEAYLQGIDRRIAWAKANNLYVFLDMHQDLYSVLYGDGAPKWATLTEGQPHLHLGGIWSDAYFTSPAVQTALDNFWKNTPAPDGVGLQEHYARIWAMLARRYADEPAVIGYDLMNEPFPGSAAADSQALLFERGAELLAQLDGPSAPTAEALAAQWLDPEGRFQILQRLRDVALYTQIIDSTQPIYNEFEQDALQGLYQRLTQAIRAVDTRRILFLETSMGSNMGVYSAIEPLAHGEQHDPQQAYAPPRLRPGRRY